MRAIRFMLVFVVVLNAPAQITPESAIRQLLDKQATDWNRGDIDAFMKAYEDSPNTTFVGEKVEYGYANILERYKKLYATPAAMGKLTFSNLAIRGLGLQLRRGHWELSFGPNHDRWRQCRRNLLPRVQE